MIRFPCDCGRQLQARDEDVGKKAKCPTCSRVMTVPSEQGAAALARLERARSEAVQPAPARESRNDREADEDRSRERKRRPAADAEGEEVSGKAMLALVLGILSLCLLIVATIPAFVLGELLLGLLSLCLPVLTAVPSLYLGARALREIRRSGGRLLGKGMARAGLALSSLS